MKYVIPRRVVVFERPYYARPDGTYYLEPIVVGDEADYKPYFLQSTCGHNQNDVIHSKYVGSDGDTFEIPDFEVVIDGRRCSYRGDAYFESNVARFRSCHAASAGTYATEIWYDQSRSWRPTGYTYKISIIRVYIRAYAVRNSSLDWSQSVIELKHNGEDQFEVLSLSGAGDQAYSIGDVISLGDVPSEYVPESRRVATYEKITDVAMIRARGLLSDTISRTDIPVYQRRESGKYAVLFEPLKDYPDGFIFQEPLRIGSKVDPLLLGNGIENNSYWFNWLVQHAYVDALQQLPKLNDNSISNVIGIIQFVKALVVEHRVQIPTSLQDAWLQYRYVVKTTELDIKEAIHFMNRYYPNTGIGMKTYGTAVCDVQDTSVICRCRIGLRSRELGTLDRIWRALYTYGLQPNFYLVWDSIPFSFIVDWFLPIGDVASNVDLLNNYSKQNYDFDSVVYSLEYIREYTDGPNVHFYSRWLGKPLEQTNDLYWFDRPSTSNKVKLYRILDTASLTVS